MFNLDQIEDQIRKGIEVAYRTSNGHVGSIGSFTPICAKQVYPFINVTRLGVFSVKLDKDGKKVIRIPYACYFGIKKIDNEGLSKFISNLVNGFTSSDAIQEDIKIQESKRTDDCSKDYTELKIVFFYNHKC